MIRSLLALALALLATPARAETGDTDEQRTPFDRGRVNISVGAGTTNSLGNRHIAIGGAVGYYVLDGLALGLRLEHEFGDPSISFVSPEVRYVVQPLVGRSPLVPYVGGFYGHWFVGTPFTDVDSIGARGGLLYVSGMFVLGGGVAYEHAINGCTADCDSIYPDLTIAIAL